MSLPNSVIRALVGGTVGGVAGGATGYGAYKYHEDDIRKVDREPTRNAAITVAALLGALGGAGLGIAAGGGGGAARVIKEKKEPLFKIKIKSKPFKFEAPKMKKGKEHKNMDDFLKDIKERIRKAKEEADNIRKAREKAEELRRKAEDRFRKGRANDSQNRSSWERPGFDSDYARKSEELKRQRMQQEAQQRASKFADNFSDLGSDVKKALNLKGDETNKKDVETLYRNLIRKHHPDMGGSSEMAQIISTAMASKGTPWFKAGFSSWVSYKAQGTQQYATDADLIYPDFEAKTLRNASMLVGSMRPVYTAERPISTTGVGDWHR
jgi:hypothetical protein